MARKTPRKSAGGKINKAINNLVNNMQDVKDKTLTMFKGATCQLCPNNQKADKFFNIYEVYLTLDSQTSLIYEFMNDFMKYKLEKDSKEQSISWICNICCTELENGIKFVRKLKKIDKSRVEVVEEPKKGSLKPNFLLTKTVSHILNQVKAPKITPRKRKVEEMEVDEVSPRKRKIGEMEVEKTGMEKKPSIEEVVDDPNKFAIPIYTFVDAESKDSISKKQLNVEPLVFDKNKFKNNLKEFIASKEANPKVLYICKYCNKGKFKTEHSLLIHVKFSHLCVYCLKCFKKESLLHNHIKKEHQVLWCTLCRSGINKQLTRNHLKKAHNLDLPANVNLINIADREILVD